MKEVWGKKNPQTIISYHLRESHLASSILQASGTRHRFHCRQESRTLPLIISINILRINTYYISALTPRMSSQSPATSTNAGGDAKRKAEPNGGTHTRAKRNRYISLAWCVCSLPSLHFCGLSR